MPNRDALKEELVQTDEEFRRLYEQHQEYERRLRLLNQQARLSQEDEIEAKRIKIEKLRLKDRMEERLRSHGTSRISA